MKLSIIKLNTLSVGGAMRALAYFPVARREEILQFRQPQDRLRSIVAEVTLRLEIMETLHLKNEEISIARGTRGKPYLENHPAFCFNLSHSGEIAVCLTDTCEAGVDVEKVRPGRYATAARCFTEREREALAASPLAFFRIWTAKESILKMRGLGLGALASLDSVSCTQDGTPLSCRVQSYALALDTGALFPLSPDETPPDNISYVLSVCTARSAPMETEFHSSEELLQKYCEICG